MAVDFDRLMSVFREALEEHPPKQWDDFVQQAAGDDEELRRQACQLLHAHAHGHSLLDKPVVASPTIDQPITEKPGTQIGPYKLLQQIGEGGMGVVYMAEQTEPVERRVALKIIKPGMDTRKVIARFEAEEQALAMMDHPNIAKVLDAGTTESGRPYFVMELVKGQPITEYCDQHQLTPRERLELFVPICQAVQHAHQKGIIHRDIKPSNVMVAEYDDRAVPKIIDFGVAKAIERRLTEKTVFTEFGQVVGTVEYMSPEQAKLNQLDIDTRTDVYSLGVLLYELLTGETPFDRERLRSAAFDEMLRIIREEEPPRPSTKLSSSESLPSIAANRNVDPQRLTSTVCGELDWIVVKALEKDRTRRYDTASKFAEDVQHYLDDEAVEACPPSATYRLRKFARRNKPVIATTASIAAALLIGTGIATWQAIRATHERDRAIVAENRAESEAAIAKAVNDFLQYDLLGMASAESQAEAEISPDPNIKLRTLLDRAAEKIEERFSDQPPIEAAIRRTLGNAYNAIGRYQQAEEQHRRALELRKQALGPEHRETLASMQGVASGIHQQGHYAEAEKLNREVLEIQRRVLGPEHPDTLTSMNNVASGIYAQGHYAEAEKVCREVLEIRQRVLGPEHPDTLTSMVNVASGIYAQGHYAEAEKLYGEVLEIQRRVRGPAHPVTLGSMYNLALAIDKQDRHPEAEKLYGEVLEIQRRVLGPEHPETLVSMGNLANAIYHQGHYAEAEKLYREVLKIQRRVLGPEHPHTKLTKSNLAIFFQNQAWRAATSPNPAERDPDIALEAARKAVELAPEKPNSWDNLGVALCRNERWQEAIDALEKAREMRGGEDPVHQFFLAMACWQAGRHDEAAENYVEAASWLLQENRNAVQYRFRDEAEDLIDTEEIIRYCTERLQNEAERPELPAVRAAAYARSGLLDQAVEDYARALSLIPETENPWWGAAGGKTPAVESDEVYQRLVVLKPDRRDLRIARVHHLAKTGRWNELSEQLETAIALDPTDHWGWYNAAAVSLYLADAEAYRRICDELTTRFADTDAPNIAERVAKACLLSPDSAGHLQLGRQLAERAVTEGASSGSIHWFQLNKALADYRAGDYELALQNAQTSLKHKANSLYANATALVVQAMAQHQLGQIDEAEQSLRHSHELMEQMPTPEDEGLDSSWADWLRFHILRREAERLIEPAGNKAHEQKESDSDEPDEAY